MKKARFLTPPTENASIRKESGHESQEAIQRTATNLRKTTQANAAVPNRRVLYTHEVVGGRRRAIRFPAASPTWRYLLSRKEKLESRTYVVDAGRAWYEIWVPQDPEAWSLPKIVFPDISPDARFFWDTKGSIVDGNCYWITANDQADEELLLFILGVANSALMSRYHDLAFQNKLYSQRRRDLTQYVNEYPLPDRDLAASKQIIKLVRQLIDGPPATVERARLEGKIDALAVQAFHLEYLGIKDTVDWR